MLRGHDLPARSSASDKYISPLLPKDHRKRYQLLKLYYDGEIYRQVNNVVRDRTRDVKGIRELENPTEQAVEFHAAHLFPGTLPEALPVESDVANFESLKASIERIWTFSNWAQKKQVYARWLPLYGDAFIKVAQTEVKRNPYMQLIHPSNVTHFEKDERGNVIYILLETEVITEDRTLLVRVEEWSHEAQRLRIWFAGEWGSEFEDKTIPPADVPDETTNTPLSDLGIDFVPFTHGMFSPNLEDDQGRGVSAVAGNISPIDELNRAVTALHDRFFRYGKPDKAMFANESGQGAPRAADTRPSPNATNVDGTFMKLQDEDIYRFPGMSKMEYLIPNIPYTAGLEMIRARQERLAESMPELRFFADTPDAAPSGISRQIRLAPAISRALECRGNAEDALIRAVKMALTIGKNAGIFPEVGSFEAGDFEFNFKEREILPTSELEDAQTRLLKLQAAQLEQTVLGVKPEVLAEELGYNPEDYDKGLAGALAGTAAGAGAVNPQAQALLQSRLGQGGSPAQGAPNTPGAGRQAPGAPPSAQPPGVAGGK